MGWNISFEGRLNRSQFIAGISGLALSIILSTVSWFLLALPLDIFFRAGVMSTLLSGILDILFAVIVLTIFVTWLSLVTRRAHDIGQGGVFAVILSLIPPINVFVFFFLATEAGLKKANDYGDVPAQDLSHRAKWLAISAIGAYIAFAFLVS